jgi:serine/threonine-protein kinase
MGVVYEGRRRSDGKSVAIKVLSGELAAKPVASARFLREARLIARLRHPHIVEIIEVGEDLERLYLVMELLEGEDLARRLQRLGAISIAEVADILVPVCDAVATAHRRGVTHRDLKPSNIFLAVKHGRTHPIVLDFGIAKAEDEAKAADAAGEGARVVFGNPMYLAPELIKERWPASPSSDQYALGVILYESLIGEQPYTADDLERLFHAITAGDPPWMWERRSDIPPALDRIVQRTMSRNPQARFSSVAGLGLALLPFVSTPVERARLGRRRPPSLPAIEIEAGTPSPFVRTRITEVLAESRRSFGAPVFSEETSGGETIQWWRIAIASVIALGIVASVLLVGSGRFAPERTSATSVERGPPPARLPAPADSPADSADSADSNETALMRAVTAEPAFSAPLVPHLTPPPPSSAPPRRERPTSAPRRSRPRESFGSFRPRSPLTRPASSGE